MRLVSRVKNRLRLRLLALLGPQLGRQTGAVGWIAAGVLNVLHRDAIRESAQMLGIGAGQTAVDVGFGGGYGLAVLLSAVKPGGTVHGVEITQVAIARAKLKFPRAIRRMLLVLHTAPVDQMPLAPGSVDGLMTVNTIHHFEDLGAAFREVARVLAPAGRFVVAFPDPQRQRSLTVTRTHRHHVRSLEVIEAELVAAGLHLKSTERVAGGAYYRLLASNSI